MNPIGAAITATTLPSGGVRYTVPAGEPGPVIEVAFIEAPGRRHQRRTWRRIQVRSVTVDRAGHGSLFGYRLSIQDGHPIKRNGRPLDVTVHDYDLRKVRPVPDQAR